MGTTGRLPRAPSRRNPVNRAAFGAPERFVIGAEHAIDGDGVAPSLPVDATMHVKRELVPVAACSRSSTSVARPRTVGGHAVILLRWRKNPGSLRGLKTPP